jgi:hypothetical protein
MNQAEFEHILTVLGTISDRFPPESVEAKALLAATEAFMHLRFATTRVEFVNHLMQQQSGLTEAQILHLKALGIDPGQQED